MLLKTHSFPTVLENVLFDECLLQLAQNQGQGECLRFWESPQYGVVMGRAGRAEEEAHLDVTSKEGIRVMNRSSGGGTVVQGPGCLNYTLVLSKQNHPQLQHLHASYAWICQTVIDALSQQGLKAVFCPISDIAMEDGLRKFSGNAQRRVKDYVLHHGTILYQFDLPKVWHYLKMPKDMPAYRLARSHETFITNAPMQVTTFMHDLACRWQAGPQAQPLMPHELSSLNLLINNFK